MFIMDASASVGEDNFKKMKEFVKFIAGRFKVSPSLTRVSVMTFSDDANIQVSFRRSSSLSEFERNVDSIPYDAGELTRIDKALVLASKQGFLVRNGGRRGVNQVCVVLCLIMSTLDLFQRISIDLHRYLIRHTNS